MPMGPLDVSVASTGGMVMVRNGGMVGAVQTSRGCCPGDRTLPLRLYGLFATSNVRGGRGGTSRG